MRRRLTRLDSGRHEYGLFSRDVDTVKELSARRGEPAGTIVAGIGSQRENRTLVNVLHLARLFFLVRCRVLDYVEGVDQDVAEAEEAGDKNYVAETLGYFGQWDTSFSVGVSVLRRGQGSALALTVAEGDEGPSGVAGRHDEFGLFLGIAHVD